MRYLIGLLCLSFLCLPALAGDPVDDYWALVQIRKANWKIDDQASALSKDLREDRTTAAKAEVEWKRLHGQAAVLKAQSLALESGSRPNVAKAVTKMMRLQILRLEGLINAARVETASGRAVARPLWIKQVIAYQNYQQQEAYVLDMMNWIENNP